MAFSVPHGIISGSLICFLELRRRLAFLLYLCEIADEVDDVVENVEKDASSSRASDKQQTSQIEIADVALLSERSKVERRLLRKLDMRFLPTIFLIYLVNYIDRTAITAARLKGLEQDLGLSDIQYDTAVAILYASYCTAQIPSNMILNQMTRPSIYIGLCVTVWGLVSAMTGITRDPSGILACRVSLGIPEAAFYPGAVYLLSRWYTRKELALRASVFYSGSLVANAFGSMMAAGILSGMEGKQGIRGWRWLFFIEGALTITVGILSIWSLPDLPSNTRWITTGERQIAQARLAEDTGEADEDLAQDSMLQGLKMALKDVKVYIFALIELCLLLGLSFLNFFPTLTATLGFNTTITLLLAAPPWILASVLCCVNALHADKTGERFFHLTLPWWASILGYIVALSTNSNVGRYVALFLMTSGYASFSLILVWVSNTVTRPPARRATSIGLVNGISATGYLIGSFTWKAEWDPKYHQSMLIGIAAVASAIFLAFVMRCLLKNENRKLDEDELGGLKGANQKRIEDAACLEGITTEEAMEKKKGFRYLY